MPSVVCSFGVRADDSRHGEIEERSFVAKSAGLKGGLAMAAEGSLLILWVTE